MTTFDPSKLSVTFIAPSSSNQPLSGRKYTFTHSDTTSCLFLSVSNNDDDITVNPAARDKVFAYWHINNKESVILGKAYICNGECNRETSRTRFKILQREIPKALEAMFYGDHQFLSNYSNLLATTPIYIYFHSVYSKFRGWHYYKTPNFYLTLNKQ
ncbi:hypothetical protein FZC66_10620 [Priestia megaterium]|nr:hypothetical protein FZC66_10620 [Priestia megaterium]